MSLNMRQEMSIWATGKCRCPHCGKFRRPADFPAQASRIRFSGGGVTGGMSVPPQCQVCIQANAGLTRLPGADPGYQSNEITEMED
jgi:hypothetical protein